MRHLLILAFVGVLACGATPTTEAPSGSAGEGGADAGPLGVDAGDSDAKDAEAPDGAACTIEGCLAAFGYNPACAVVDCVDNACTEVRLRPPEATCELPDGIGHCHEGICVPFDPADGGSP